MAYDAADKKIEQTLSTYRERLAEIGGNFARYKDTEPSLTRIPDEISALNGIRGINFYGHELEDISAIVTLTELKSLTLCQMYAVDLSPISKLTKLEELRIARFSIHDLSFLTPLKNLRTLSLEGLPRNPERVIFHLGALRKMRRIEDLTITGATLRDVDAISRLSRLKRIYIGDTGINAISFLSGLRRLERVTLYEPQLADSGPLSRKPNLEELTLVDNQVRELSAITTSDKLRKLDVHGTQITDIAPLSNLPVLRDINANHCPICDLSGWNTKSRVRVLRLSGTKVSDIRPLSGTRLSGLDLSDTPISDLSGLSALPNLTGLSINRTHVDSFDEILRNPSLLPNGDTREMDYRDANAHWFGFVDTPLAASSAWLTEISTSRDALAALKEHFKIASPSRD
ncbi:MAG: hypothetical protein ABI459_08420, partial [Deltaproteobacteria bacterium]